MVDGFDDEDVQQMSYLYYLHAPISLRTTVMMSPSYGSLRSQYSCAYFQSYDFLQIPF
jgi:hypothetical protein